MMTLATTIVVNDDDSSHDEDYADVIVITTTLHFTGARDDGVAVASAGPYANNLHLAPDR